MAFEIFAFLVVCLMGMQKGVLAVDNNVAGAPRVSCGEEAISVSIPTKKPFLGRIFVKGLSKNPDCGRQFDNNTDTTAKVDIKFGSCGMNRERKLAPVPGLEESLTLIVSFHYLFVTKIDRAYNVQCFYGQQNFATVTYGYNVSLMSTEMVQNGQKRAFQNQMPSCTYEVRKGSMNGSLVQYATVGDELYHMWSCGTNGTSEGKILVKNCYVAEGNGDRFLVIDSRGCAIDPAVISDLNYAENSTVAWVRTFAFKFADTPNMAFSCTIQVCLPEENENCDDVTPPRCSMSENVSDIIKKTRRLADTPMLLHDEIDVSSPSFNVLDAGLHVESRSGLFASSDPFSGDGNISDHKYVRSHPHHAHTEILSNLDQDNPLEKEDYEEFCVSKMSFVLILLISLALFSIFIAVSIILFVALMRSKRFYHWKPTGSMFSGIAY